MTTPPPPPAGPGAWPPSEPSGSPPQRASWWTGGRIAVAVIVVLVLMGLSAAAGFVAGVAWGGFSAIDDVVGSFDEEMFDEGFELDGTGDVPGLTPLDVQAATGAPLVRGGQVAGTLRAEAVDHDVEVAVGGRIEIEVRSDEFDTVLVLLDAAGELLDANDDGAGGTDSRLVAELEPGSYVVRVQSWSGGLTGSYELTVD